jgi:WD40 repeat protein
MDVDSDGEQQREFPPDSVILHTLVNGESRAVQVEPAEVTDLANSTTVFGLDHTNLAQVLWRPDDTSLLTGRSDTVCGLWRLPESSQSPPTTFQELIRIPPPTETCVTAIAWAPSGAMLAIALSTPTGGEVHVYDGSSFGLVEILSASQRIVMRLQWQRDSTRLVGVSRDASTESSIMQWSISAGGGMSQYPSTVTVPETLEDIDCAMFENQAFVCASGGRVVYHLRAYAELEVEQKFWSNSATENENWAFVKCAWQSANESLIVAASDESGRIWLPSRDLVHEAHHAPITGLQIRPRLTKGRQALSTSEFATCSVDGTIKAFSYSDTHNSITTLCKLTLGYSQPLKALSYSPDGFCLAGASYADLRIWNAEHRYNLMASWQASASDWDGNAIKDRDLVSNDGVTSLNGDSTAVEHSLSWDADSMRVAFSLASQVCIRRVSMCLF